jgi:hypothetical protein
LSERHSSTNLDKCRDKDVWSSRFDDIDQLMHRKSGSDGKAEEVDKLRSTLSTSSIGSQ